MKTWLKGSALGGALALSAGMAWEAGHYLVHSAPPSTVAVQRPLTAFPVDPSWVLSGEPHFRSTETVRTPDGSAYSGLWACDGPSTFQWTFGLDETVHVLEGQVDVTYNGHRFTLRPGDTATFHAGTQAVWHVPEHLKKAYTLHHPGRLALLWRKLFPVEVALPSKV
jgi:uncharacterized cupin superfamily protein